MFPAIRGIGPFDALAEVCLVMNQSAAGGILTDQMSLIESAHRRASLGSSSP